MEPFSLLEKVVREFEVLKISYFVTGSIAAMAYGEPRLTNDIDIVSGVDHEHIGDLLKAFPQGEFYINEDTVREAILHQSQFNIIHPASGLKVDVMVRKDTAFDRSRFERIRRVAPDESYVANFSSPEDVIIIKMVFYKEGSSEKHLRDITGILKVSGDELDRNYISKWVAELDLSEIWDALLKRVSD